MSLVRRVFFSRQKVQKMNAQSGIRNRPSSVRSKLLDGCRLNVLLEVLPGELWWFILDELMQPIFGIIYTG
jgi:hypothetical protein